MSSLSGEIFATPTLRTRHTPAKPSEDGPGEWAPCRTLYRSKRACGCHCIDRTGRHRAHHDLDHDGRCIFCSWELPR